MKIDFDCNSTLFFAPPWMIDHTSQINTQSAARLRKIGKKSMVQVLMHGWSLQLPLALSFWSAKLMHGHLSAHTVCKLLIYKSAVLLLLQEGPAAVGVAHRIFIIRRAVKVSQLLGVSGRCACKATLLHIHCTTSCTLPVKLWLKPHLKSQLT